MASPAYRASTGWKAAATSLWAIVADCVRESFQYLAPIVSSYLRSASRYLWAIAAPHLRESTRYLRAVAAPYLRESSRYLWAAAARYLRQSTEYLGACLGAYLGAAVAGYFEKSSKIQIAAVALIAIVSSLGGFLTTYALLQPPEPPVTVREIRPPPPKFTWVTGYESDRAHQLGRLLLDISPAELLSIYERNGSDAIETYRDGWVKIDYPIMSFDRQTFGKATYDVVEAAAHFRSVFPGKIIAIFNGQKWHARLVMHRIGDQIVAYCKFKEIEREEVLTNIHRLWFYGTGCDLPQL